MRSMPETFAVSRLSSPVSGCCRAWARGAAPHLAAVRAGTAPIIDHERFAPYPVHPLGAVDFDRQIPKKSDQRQMEPWQRIGVYAAVWRSIRPASRTGRTSRTGFRSSSPRWWRAGSSGRWRGADGLKSAANPGAFLNERLMGDLRPTLFLAQLSNLLAGNISIVHGVTGPSRTFMGEEQAGVDAVRIAQARIAAGQADMILVGGSYNAERQDMLLLFELGDALREAPFRPVFDRADDPGLITGSMGAFSGARIGGSCRGARCDGYRQHRSCRGRPRAPRRCWRDHAGTLDTVAGYRCGRHGRVRRHRGRTGDRRRSAGAVRRVPADRAWRSCRSRVEAAFPMAVGLAAALVQAGDADAALATGVGHWRGEGAVRLSRA